MIARLALVVIALLGACKPSFAQLDHVSENQIKAAYLYQFGSFVEWPPRAFARADSPFTIGLIGADAIAAEVERVVSTRTVQSRQVAVRKLQPGAPLEGLHVLFVGRAEAARLPEILLAAKADSVLVVTESEDALSQGSVINFVAVGNKIRFDVALAQAERRRLRISSRLLGVARRVLQVQS